MSYDISSGVEDAKDQLKAIQTIAAAYPDAYKSEGRWRSHSLKVADCDSIAIIESPKGGAELAACKLVDKIRIFPGGGFEGVMPLTLVLLQLHEREPEAYAKLLEVLSRR